MSRAENASMLRSLLPPAATLLALFACAPVAAAEWPTAKLGPIAAWDAATDRAAGARYIPMQLIVPGAWDGTRRIDLPLAKGDSTEETVWTGPQEWKHPHSGKTLSVYDRRRTTRREGLVMQKMAVRDDGAAIGRVADSRFGGLICEQEAKFPLGVWKRGEVRTFDYVCLGTREGSAKPKKRTSRISIEELDYECDGTAHCLRFKWRLTDGDSGEVLDQRTYILAPGRGLIGHERD